MDTFMGLGVLVWLNWFVMWATTVEILTCQFIRWKLYGSYSQQNPGGFDDSEMMMRRPRDILYYFLSIYLYLGFVFNQAAHWGTVWQKAYYMGGVVFPFAGMVGYSIDLLRGWGF